MTPSGDELGVEISTYTRDLLKTLESETGQATGFKDIGYLKLVCTPEWLEERRRMAVAARKLGVNYHLCHVPGEVAEMIDETVLQIAVKLQSKVSYESNPIGLQIRSMDATFS